MAHRLTARAATTWSCRESPARAPALTASWRDRERDLHWTRGPGIWLRVSQTDSHMHRVHVRGHRAHDVPPSPTACFRKLVDDGGGESALHSSKDTARSGAHRAAKLLLCSALFIVWSVPISERIYGCSACLVVCGHWDAGGMRWRSWRSTAVRVVLVMAVTVHVQCTAHLQVSRVGGPVRMPGGYLVGHTRWAGWPPPLGIRGRSKALSKRPVAAEEAVRTQESRAQRREARRKLLVHAPTVGRIAECE